MSRVWLPAVVILAVLPLAAPAQDTLKSVKDRMKIEAERVEREFAEGRAAAYKLVRSDNPQLADATEKLDALLSMIEKDSSLDQTRRRTLIVTLKWDLDKVKEIAAERRRSSTTETVKPSTIRRERETPRSSYEDQPRTKDVRSTIQARKDALADQNRDRDARREANPRVQNDVVRSAVPATDADRFPKDWAEKSRRRSKTQMTAKERAIMTALNKTIEVDLSSYTFSEAIDYLKKMTGIEIAVDKRGLDDASVTYDTKLNLKMKASTRTVIRRLLSDLGLAYYVKDEALQITSLERARSQTTVRTYYVGDLAAVTDTRLPYVIRQLQMIETINTIIGQIKNIEPKSWKDNDAEAQGSVVFNPAQMTLMVRQTAEFHFMMSGK